MSLLPSKQIAHDINTGRIKYDPAQEEIIPLLDALYKKVDFNSNSNSIFNKIFRKKENRGVYLWGEVGRGKTYLMDVLYNSLPTKQKQRLHFYEFMQDVHKQLHILQNAREKNPLKQIANNIAEKTVILCLDELHITDVTDAMVVANLWQYLFKREILLFATSNTEPVNLYQGGVQRKSFLPFIDLIYKYTEVVCLDGDKDYRLTYLADSGTYHYPLTKDSASALELCFTALTKGMTIIYNNLNINSHELITNGSTSDILWCSYAQLCVYPRSPADYLVVANTFHTILLSGVPTFTSSNEDAARRFISLIDILYDSKVKLVIAAACDIASLYQGRLHKTTFERTKSRLLEMQSSSYLQKKHMIITHGK